MRWVNLAVTAATLAVLVWQLGTGPFLDGLRAVDGEALAAAAGLAVLTTACCAWRWRIVARGLGVDLPLGTAVAAYYRSIFLNVTLPGGIVGDVHRGINHGLRAVVWERSAGQVVQIVLTVAVLLVVASPVRPVMPFVALALRRPSRWPLAAGWSITRAWAVDRARVGAGRRGPRGDVPDRRADRGGDRAAVRTAAAGAARAGWPRRCPTSAAGGRARAWRRGRSPPPAWARHLESRPVSYMA